MSSAPTSSRLSSIDAYRGFVMFLMMAECLRLGRMARNFPESPVWQFLALHQSHVEWVGCTLHDLIQPSFSFLVGVALPFSIASRLAHGQSRGRMLAHAAWRAFLLSFLGIFLRSVGRSRTNFTFEDTLTQIGLGYFPLFLLALAPRKIVAIALIVLLVGYWGAFAYYPLPGPDFDYKTAGVTPDWEYNLTDFAAHWNKNTNPAWAFDRWFMNLFPRDKPFLNNGGGYATLSFIPTLATMILGLFAGDWLRLDWKPWKKIGLLLLASAICFGAGLGLHFGGYCPIVKRIWTPSWTLFSGGYCFAFLAGFHAVIDVWGLQAWSYPLRVIGANSIVAYVLAHELKGYIENSFKTHLGADVFKTFGAPYEPLVTGIATLAVLWLILFWMYRKGIYVRI